MAPRLTNFRWPSTLTGRQTDSQMSSRLCDSPLTHLGLLCVSSCSDDHRLQSIPPFLSTAADFGVLNPPAVFTFTSSQSVDCTQITIVNDNVVEATEFFSVSLDSTNPQVVIGISTASVFIADDDGKMNEWDMCSNMHAFTYILLNAEALFEFTQNTYIGLENVASPPDIPFAIRLASTSDILGQPVTVTVTSISGAGSATGIV